MPQTPDRFPGRGEQPSIILDDRTGDGDPTDERAIRYHSGGFRMMDSLGVFNPRGGSLPAATADGQVLFAKDGALFTVEQPIVSSDGWLANECGELLVEGL